MAFSTTEQTLKHETQVAVVGNTLWLLGGTVEVGDKEITLDDMWRLDLAKLDGWTLVQVCISHHLSLCCLLVVSPFDAPAWCW